MAIECKRNITFSVLNKEKVERLHEASIELVSRVGMRFGGERALKLLREAGCEMGEKGLVKIPRSLVEKALQTVPKQITLYNRAGEPAMTVDSRNQVYFGCHSDMLEIVDPVNGQVRDFMKEDTEMMCGIADALPNIHFVLSVGLAKNVKPAIQSQISFIETLKHFSKTINFSTNDTHSLKEVIDIAAMAAGGLKNLQEKPFLFNYCEPIPPLTHPEESTEKLYISAENRIPVVYMPYCMMGGTSPMNRATTLLQCNAEVLAGLVLHQLVSEGAPFIYGAMPSIMDMKTTVGSYGAIEFHLLVAAASEMSNYYGIPFYGTAGCTDAKFLDEQASVEAALQIISTLMSKANLVHDIGVSDHCNSVNPELVVLCDEIIETFKYYTQGVEIADSDLDLGLFEKVGPGGAYLNEMQTMKNFRKVFYPTLFSRLMKNPDHSQVKEKIRDKIAGIRERHNAVANLDGALVKELDQWTKRLEARG